MKKTKIEIKTWWGILLFDYSCTDNSIKKTLEKAVEKDAYLQGAYLQGADLQGAYLQGAYLQGADLQGAYLQGADLQGAYLRGAYLQDAYLQGADLQGAYLRGADLQGAYLQGADNIPFFCKDGLSILAQQKNKLIAYKFLDEDWKSPIQSTNQIEYKIGKIYKEKIEKDKFQNCGQGLNIATLDWCLKETENNLDKIYIEVEFDPKDLIVPYFSDGKFRVSKLKVIRQLTKKELKDYMKDLK